MARPKGDGYTQAIGDLICSRIAEGLSLRAICKQDDDLPTPGAVCGWLAKHPEFAEQYTRAREIQCEILAAEIIDIANNPQMGETTKVSEKGVEVRTGDMIEHRRLQVDARKWYLAKVAPKKYGDRLELAGDAANPLKLDTTLTVTFVDSAKEESK